MLHKDEVAKAVKSALQDLYGSRLAKLILFGSYARGDEHEDSDIDFLVVLKDDSVKTGAEIRFMNRAMVDLQLKFDTIISTYPTSLNRYDSSGFLFYKNVRREGIEV